MAQEYSMKKNIFMKIINCGGGKKFDAFSLKLSASQLQRLISTCVKQQYPKKRYINNFMTV